MTAPTFSLGSQLAAAAGPFPAGFLGAEHRGSRTDGDARGALAGVRAGDRRAR